jgi:ATP-binding cassette subfamily E protein 1
MPFGVREGINIFLAGFVPTENLRFRDESLTFRVTETAEEEQGVTGASRVRYAYPDMTKTFKDTETGEISQFRLTVKAGSFSDSEIVVLLGENGTGKTTFIKMLAGKGKPDQEDVVVPELNVSFKPQMIAPKFPGTVAELLSTRIRNAYNHAQFQADVFKPLNIHPLMDNKVQTLSGGELQRVALCLCLGTPADVYLIDEPSAYLDSEQRLLAAKIIKRFILHTKKTAFIVEHDFIMATYLANRVIVYEGSPGKECVANEPQTLLSGMNKFLKQLEITFRRDPTNFRPRINKMDSIKDKEQKESGNYFYMDTFEDEEEEVEGEKKRRTFKGSGAVDAEKKPAPKEAKRL